MVDVPTAAGVRQGKYLHSCHVEQDAVDGQLCTKLVSRRRRRAAGIWVRAASAAGGAVPHTCCAAAAAAVAFAWRRCVAEHTDLIWAHVLREAAAGVACISVEALLDNMSPTVCASMLHAPSPPKTRNIAIRGGRRGRRVCAHVSLGRHFVALTISPCSQAALAARKRRTSRCGGWRCGWTRPRSSCASCACWQMRLRGCRFGLDCQTTFA